MTEVTLSCFSGFTCIAGRCPDTCCVGWEDDLDEATLERYRQLPGPLGRELRAAICQEDGDSFFALKDGACPFLNHDRLCRLILAQGDGILSVTCREHPRFWEEYGSRRETCLSISCPEAARLLLERPLEPVVCETPEVVPEDPELDPAFFQQLLVYRSALFVLSRSTLPLSQKFSLALDAADNGIALPTDGTLPKDFWQGVPAPPLTLPLPAYLRAMEHMEFTRSQLPELLRRYRACPPPIFWDIPEYQEAGGRLLFYFFYRYVLRGVWSGLVAEKVRFSVFSTAAILALSEYMDAPAPGRRILDAAVLYSREVEHSPENLDLLYEHLCSASDEYS